MSQTEWDELQKELHKVRTLLGVTDGQEARYRDLREQWNVALDRWNALIEDRIVPYSETAGPAILVPAWQ